MISTSRTVNIASKILLSIALCIFVLAILTLSLVIYNESATIDNENIIKAKLNIQSVMTMIEDYKKDTGDYPSDLSQLIGIYMTKIPEDIWNNPYFYEYIDGEDSYRVYTLGYGREVGGSANQRDYDNNTNWDLVY